MDQNLMDQNLMDKKSNGSDSIQNTIGFGQELFPEMAKNDYFGQKVQHGENSKDMNNCILVYS